MLRVVHAWAYVDHPMSLIRRAGCWVCPIACVPACVSRRISTGASVRAFGPSSCVCPGIRKLTDADWRGLALDMIRLIDGTAFVR